MALHFSKRKESSLLGHTVVIYDAGGSKTIQCQIQASQYGVGINAKVFLLQSMDDLQVLAKTLSDAWVDHESLKPRIEVTKEMPRG